VLVVVAPGQRQAASDSRRLALAKDRRAINVPLAAESNE
jgi:hypothetical protein